MFTIETSPYSWKVERTRDDLSFLIKRLREEFPVDNIIEIDKGSLDKPILEVFFRRICIMKSVNRSKTLIEFLSNDTQEYIDEMTKANKTWIKGLKSKIFNSQILADIVLSEKEKK